MTELEMLEKLKELYLDLETDLEARQERQEGLSDR